MKKVIKGLFILLFGLFISFYNPKNILASSATIKVSSSSSKVVVGKTFYVYIKVSSSKKIGTIQFTPSYDKSMFKLESGTSPVYEYQNIGYSKTYTYKFKAISTGSSKITVKSYEVIDYQTENKMSLSIDSKKVSVITQAELEASYSKNNDLKSLKVDGLTLSPKFDDDVLNYKVEAGANTTSINIKATPEDSRSKVSGTGKKKVSEGENKFKIVVTAQNGNTKTYVIIVNVVDPNPITVEIDGQIYTIVKRESSLDKIDDYSHKTITINNQSIPTLFNKENNITLVGLKNTEGDIKYFIYNELDNSYKEYKDITLSKLRILPLDIDKKINDYKNETIKIDDIDVNALSINDNIYIIKAKNFDTAEENYYYYDKESNTVIKYYDNNSKKEEIIPINQNDDIKHYKKIIMLLGIETIIIFFVLICILIKKVRKNKRKREYLIKKIEEEKNRKEEVQKLQNEIKELESKNKTSKPRSKKKEVSKDESKKKK